MFTESFRIGCSFPACLMFDISPTLHDSVSEPRLCPPGNRPVVGLHDLWYTLSVLSYIVAVLSGSTS